MITEDYINKEIMKLLLEKGCPLNKVLVQDFRPVWYTKDYNDPTWQDCDAYYIPTQSQVMKWLREVHKLYVVVRPYVTEEEFFSLFDVKSVKEKGTVVNLRTKTGFTTYEEACEAAIRYCLEKLI